MPRDISVYYISRYLTFPNVGTFSTFSQNSKVPSIALTKVHLQVHELDSRVRSHALHLGFVTQVPE